jgi:hypothetical protein
MFVVFCAARRASRPFRLLPAHLGPCVFTRGEPTVNLFCRFWLSAVGVFASALPAATLICRRRNTKAALYGGYCHGG